MRIEKYEIESKRAWERVASVLCRLNQKGSGEIGERFVRIEKYEIESKTVLGKIGGRFVLIGKHEICKRLIQKILENMAGVLCFSRSMRLKQNVTGKNWPAFCAD